MIKTTQPLKFSVSSYIDETCTMFLNYDMSKTRRHMFDVQGVLHVHVDNEWLDNYINISRIFIGRHGRRESETDVRYVRP